MPNGDVIPNGDPRGDVPIPPTCAAAEPPAKTAAVSVASDQRVNLRRRVIVMFPSSAVETAAVQDHRARDGVVPCLNSGSHG